jgi:hypothetical protein
MVDLMVSFLSIPRDPWHAHRLWIKPTDAPASGGDYFSGTLAS